ncbi:Protein TIC 40, chloroplastic [Cymbomonas tetramitiformis]|uniref:Protein TIC 40, chloroplastic n=1 Tax=Cymbomonas tetramitiformis TaxID=36881 RepID=A0AAE0F134_9CHLO|nr:Protein TIC 40, chloroplastic [Cymbomonas tetramitiformis]
MGAIGAIAPVLFTTARTTCSLEKASPAHGSRRNATSRSSVLLRSRKHTPGRRGDRFSFAVRAAAESETAPSVSAIPPSLLSTVAPGTAPEPVYVASVQVPTARAPEQASTGYPPWMWVGVGVLISFGGLKLMEFMRSKQQDIQAMAMQQMMKTMMNQSGMPPPPGGMPGAMPNAPGGMPFGGAPFGQPIPTPPPPPAYTPPPTPAYDTTAQPAPSSTPADIPKETSKESTSTEKDAPADAVKEKKEKTAPKKSTVSMFEDIDPNAVEAKSDTVDSGFADSEIIDDTQNQFDPSQWAASGAWPPPPGGEMPPPPPGGMPGMTIEMFEKMIEDPTMQQMIYPYLPEGMRNPDTFKWMLQNPEYRAQLEQMLQNGPAAGMPGGMPNMPDMNSPEMKQQFEQLGMEPQDVMQKIMGDPQVASAFQNPRIQAAIMDVSQNPNNMYKYTGDQEVMDLLFKINNMFPNAGGPPGYPPPGQPGGF